MIQLSLLFSILWITFMYEPRHETSKMWYVRQVKAQISMRIRACAGWSEPLLVAWIFYDSKATDLTSFGDSQLKRRVHRLVLVYIFQNDTSLKITCRGSYVKCLVYFQVVVIIVVLCIGDAIAKKHNPKFHLSPKSHSSSDSSSSSGSNQKGAKSCDDAPFFKKQEHCEHVSFRTVPPYSMCP